MPCPFCPGGGFGASGGIIFIVNLILSVLFLTGIGLLIWWLVTRAAAGGRMAPGARPENRALEILDERYAKGEISKEEYEERKKILQRG